MPLSPLGQLEEERMVANVDYAGCCTMRSHPQEALNPLPSCRVGRTDDDYEDIEFERMRLRERSLSGRSYGYLPVAVLFVVCVGCFSVLGGFPLLRTSWVVNCSMD